MYVRVYLRRLPFCTKPIVPTPPRPPPNNCTQFNNRNGDWRPDGCRWLRQRTITVIIGQLGQRSDDDDEYNGRQ